MADPAATLTCVRCGRDAAPAEKVTYGGALGEAIRAKVCNTCWLEWTEAEVMVINELRLDFMDPKSLEVIEKHLRDFLMLG